MSKQLEDYHNQIPGNSVKVLQDFLNNQMNHMNAKETLSSISIEELRMQSNNTSRDFFQHTVNALKKGMRSRAEVLRRGQSIESIFQLCQYFNTHLKGKFPFHGPLQASNTNTEDADPERIKEFFKLYNEKGGSAKEILDQIDQLGNKARPLISFFNQLDKVKEFFGSFLTADQGITLPTFDMQIQFRANRDKEQQGDMIADWVFKSSPLSRVSKKDASQNTQWIYGNTIQFEFRWPISKHIVSMPATDPKQTALLVDKETATFTFQGPWSLLRVLHTQKAQPTEYPYAKNSPHLMLKFVIPTNTQSNTIVYNKLTLFAPSINDKKKGAPLIMPEFPALAPEIDPSLIQASKFPLLTEGKIKPTT